VFNTVVAAIIQSASRTNLIPTSHSGLPRKATIKTSPPVATLISVKIGVLFGHPVAFPTWSIEELDACFVVLDDNEQALAYVYFDAQLPDAAQLSSNEREAEED
jgi:hypothetical protein